MSLKNNEQVKRDHETIRNGVGFYDFTHELLKVTGPQAGEFLDKIMANTMAGLNDGQGKYTQMLNEDGIIIDDLIIFKVPEDGYWVSTLYADQMIEVFDQYIDQYDAQYHDIRNDYLMYAVQGPKSRDVLNKILDNDISDMKWFTIASNHIEYFPVLIARAGYTGELGYEILAERKYRNAIEKRLREAGEEFEIANTTSNAILFSLPREKGYVLMSDVGETNPLESGFGWAVDWDTDFIGKEALAKVKENGAERKLLGFELVDQDIDESLIEDGVAIEKDGETVGKVVTFTYGFTIEKYIGYALVEVGKAKKGEAVKINGLDAKLVDRMFFDPSNERLTK